VYEALSVESGHVPEGERKTFTALFANIKGSMDLMGHLDPEQARAIVDPALKADLVPIPRASAIVATISRPSGGNSALSHSIGSSEK
jgi:hypothetical protein